MSLTGVPAGDSSLTAGDNSDHRPSVLRIWARTTSGIDPPYTPSRQLSQYPSPSLSTMTTRLSPQRAHSSVAPIAEY